MTADIKKGMKFNDAELLLLPQQTEKIGSWDLHRPTNYSIKLQYIWCNALSIPESVLCFFKKTTFPVLQ